MPWICRRVDVESPVHLISGQVHEDVINRVTAGIQAWGFRCVGVCESPIKGEKSGNTEFLSYFIRDPSTPITVSAVDMADANSQESLSEEGDV